MEVLLGLVERRFYDMPFSNLFLILTILAGLWGAGNYFLFLHFRNIYTQKIIYLNHKFANLSPALISEFKISSFHEFRVSIKGEEGYPPNIYDKYLTNPYYKGLVQDFNNERIKLDRSIRSTIKWYGILLLIIGVIWILIPLSHVSIL